MNPRWFALSLLLACDGPTLSLAERIVDGGGGGGGAGDGGVDASTPDAGDDAAARSDADADADIDEDFIPCSNAAQCPDPREPDEVLCDLTRGECVECLSDADCDPGETCDDDGECDD